MIVLLMDHLQQIIESNGFDHEAVKRTMEEILFPVSEGLSINFYFLFQNYLWLSPRPADPIEARWGLRKCDMILGHIRSGYQSIRFIENRYRKRDPKYADYAIGQQREIIRRLHVEWDRSRQEDTDRINWTERRATLR
jgi:hypothetical protein